MFGWARIRRHLTAHWPLQACACTYTRRACRAPAAKWDIFRPLAIQQSKRWREFCRLDRFFSDCVIGEFGNWVIELPRCKRLSAKGGCGRIHPSSTRPRNYQISKLPNYQITVVFPSTTTSIPLALALRFRASDLAQPLGLSSAAVYPSRTLSILPAGRDRLRQLPSTRLSPFPCARFPRSAWEM